MSPGPDPGLIRFLVGHNTEAVPPSDRPVHGAARAGYALHDCLLEKRHPEGEFARVVRALPA